MPASHPFADAIVVAAGASTRMGGGDKCMLVLHGRPLLAWAVEAIAAARSVDRIVIVTAPERIDSLAAESWLPDGRAAVVAGGGRRQESVAAGLAQTTANVVLVHDGARPLVTPELVDRVADAASKHGAAIPVVRMTETLKRLDGGLIQETLSRDGLAIAQTPQGARRQLLVDAFRAHPPTGTVMFTDEASLLEKHGVSVVAIEGLVENLKVTEPADLGRAEALLGRRLGPPRTGLGVDSHPFGAELGLALGGIVIDDAPRLAGHSDGDVALHAIADALLGAAGMGDLGRVFPSGDPGTRGAVSSLLLARVVADVRRAGWQPVSIDVTMTARRPRLGADVLERMRSAIADVLGIPVDSVGVKASTGNLIGSDGAGRSISASAIATIERRHALGQQGKWRSG